MDKFGVPKKVNRHVIRAVYALANKSANSDLMSICEEVKCSMKNNVPVPNLMSAVRQSLLNLCKLGIIVKCGSNYYYRSIDKDNMTPRAKRNETRTKKKNRKPAKALDIDMIMDEDFGSFSPRKKRKHTSSDDSMAEYFLERRKLKKKDKHLSLSKIQKHLNFEVSNENDDADDVLSCNSFGGNERVSEDESLNKSNSRMEMRSLFPSHNFKSKSLTNVAVQRSSDNSKNLFIQNEFNTFNEPQLLIQSTIQGNDEQNEHQTTLETQDCGTSLLQNGVNDSKEETCERTFLT